MRGLPLRLALRDLRGGLGGLRLLAICLFLGVAAIAGVGSLSSAIVAGLAAQGQDILGGDVSVEIAQRRATAEERAAFADLGQVAEVIAIRANIRAPSTGETMIGELKAVDGAYPLYGRFTVAGGGSVQDRLRDGVLLGEGAAARLGITPGDELIVGRARLPFAGTLTAEPDKIAEGFVVGPTILISMKDFAATGFERPGTLFKSQYRIRTGPVADFEALEKDLIDRFPDAGFDVDTRDNAAPGARRFILNTGQFLTLVGLTSLLVAGVGVGSGVSSYLATKTRSIAALKSVGADSGLILRLYLWQIGIVALVSVLLGAAVGALVPWAVGRIAADTLPVPPVVGIFPAPLLSAILYGLLAALTFALWPLSQAREVPAARLFRAGVERMRPPPRAISALIAAAALTIAALAIAQAREPLFAAGFVAAAVAVLALLFALASLIRWAAAALPRPRRPLLRLALANLSRPGGMTRQLVVALGLGLTMFTALAVIETNLSAQIENTIPAEAPTHFTLNIPSEGIDRYRRIAADAGADVDDTRMVPSLRGPITAINGVEVADMEEIPEGAWVLRGDRGLTFARDLPPANRLVEGNWWPADYSGPQLLSLDAEIAGLLDLKPGDTLTVSVLGIPMTATIANLREIDWGSLGFNFALVYSPGPIEQAPHSYMATVRIPEARDKAFMAGLGEAFPSSTTIRVADIVDSASLLLRQLTTAIRAAASVAILAGLAVLVGAIAAARRARTYDAVMLKVLGGTRAQILGAFLIEFLVLALTVALLSLLLGAVGGWYVVTQVFELEWLPGWPTVIAVAAAGAGVVTLFSLAGAWSSLRARPARALRAL